jgi:hypothetical protein
MSRTRKSTRAIRLMSVLRAVLPGAVVLFAAAIVVLPS